MMMSNNSSNNSMSTAHNHHIHNHGGPHTIQKILLIQSTSHRIISYSEVSFCLFVCCFLFSFSFILISFVDQYRVCLCLFLFVSAFNVICNFNYMMCFLHSSTSLFIFPIESGEFGT